MCTMPDEVQNSDQTDCVQCPVNTVPNINQDGCSGCLKHQIANNSSCIDCPVGEVPSSDLVQGFENCVGVWCLQHGLTKKQYTRCESSTNNGETCHNPEIRYGNVEGGIPREHSSNQYNTWCKQLGGTFKSYTTGTRAGYCVFGCNKTEMTFQSYAAGGTEFKKFTNYLRTKLNKFEAISTSLEKFEQV